MLVGTAAGWIAAPVAWPLVGLMLVVVVALQAATNMVNEVADFIRGVDDVGSPGIAGVLVSGELSPAAAQRVALFVYAGALVAGLGLVWARGWVLLAMGLSGIAVSYLYSAGPLPIASTPFGELVVGFFMGPLAVLASEVAATGRVSGLGLLASVPVAFSVSAILLGNNLRDLPRDAERGRRTLAVLVGSAGATRVLTGLLGGVFLWCVALVGAEHLPLAALLLAAVPAGWSILRTTRTRQGLERVVPALGRFHLMVGVLLGLALALTKLQG